MKTDPPEYNPEATWEAPGLAAALAEVQRELPKVAKDKTGKVEGVNKAGKQFSYEYKYADLADVSAAILPKLGEHGLAWTCMPMLRDDGQFVVRYRLIHVSGEEITGDYPIELGEMQKTGGRITYARRYALAAVTGVATEEDTDARGDDSKPQRARKPPATRQRPAERGPTPPGQDLWTDQPAGQLPSSNGVDPENRQGSIDERQRRKLLAYLGKLRREERLGKLAGIVGRLVDSTNDLSWVEADKALKAIEEEAKETAKAATP